MDENGAGPSNVRAHPRVVDLTLDDSDVDIALEHAIASQQHHLPVASGSRPLPPRHDRPRHPPARERRPTVVEVSSDEEDAVVEVDRQGRRVARRVAPLIQIPLPGQRLHPPPYAPNHPPNARPQPHPQAAAGIQILDPPPPPRNLRHINSPPPRAEPYRVQAGNRPGGAILALNGRARAPGQQGWGAALRRNIGFSFHYEGMDEEDDDENPFLANRGTGFASIAQLLNEIAPEPVRRLPGFGVGFDLPPPAPPLNDVPAYDPTFLHRGKPPRVGFTYSFNGMPRSADWRPITEAQNSNGEAPNSFLSGALSSMISGAHSLIGMKRSRPRASPTVIDLSTDASDTESDAGSEDNRPIFVCTGCNSPLMMDLEKADKIWALRCGHMICGGCLERIGQPPPPPPTPQTVMDLENGTGFTAKQKGKGKARQISSERDHSPVAGTSKASVSTSRYASLRSRKAGAAYNALHGDHTSNALVVSDGEGSEEEYETEDEANRPSSSTRRSTRHYPGTASRTPGHSSNARKPKPKYAAARRTAAFKTKRTLRPKVHQTWVYTCPVVDCDQQHTRVLIGVTLEEAVWRPKGNLGEIAVYT